MRCTLVFALCLAAEMVGALSASGALLAYEPLDYGSGVTVMGQSGGTGFSGAWVAGGYNASLFNNYVTMSQSLAYGPLAATGGGARTPAVSSLSGLTRQLGTSLGTAGTTAYLSFLVQPQGVLNAGAYNGFFGLYLDGTGDSDLFVGKPGSYFISRYVMETRGGNAQYASSLTPVIGQSALLVLKAEFLTGADRFTLYTNPTPGGSEPATGVVKSDLDLGTCSSLVLYSTGEFAIDEIRIGQTYADVTPVPEPRCLLLILTAGTFLLLHRGRR